MYVFGGVQRFVAVAYFCLTSGSWSPVGSSVC